MDKYRNHIKERFPKERPEPADPLVAAQRVLIQGRFSDQVKEQFFDEAYGDILADLFCAWLKTEPHETKTREFLYSSAMALGSIKGKMINYSQAGRNAPVIAEQKKQDAQEGGDSQEGTTNA